MDRIMELDKWTDVLSLYMFYYYTAKWQKTNQPKASNSYCMKGLEWGNVRFNQSKKSLIDLGLVEQVKTVGGTGQVTGWYMKMNYILKQDTVQRATSPHVDISTTNALNTNSVNALNTNILETPSEKAIIDKKKILPVKAKTPVARLSSFYLKMWRAKFGNVDQTLNFPKLSAMYKPYIETHGEYVVALCIMNFFTWRGASGTDQFLEGRLQSACYPMDWLPTHINAMIPFMKNALGIDVSNEEVVETIINKKINELYETN